MAFEIGLGCKMEMLKVGLEGTRIVVLSMFYDFFNVPLYGMGNPIGWIIVLVIAILVHFYGLLYDKDWKELLNETWGQKGFFFLFLHFSMCFEHV